EAAGIGQFGRVGQFRAPDVTHGVEYVARGDTRASQRESRVPGEIRIPQLGCPFTRKAVTHRQNDPAALLGTFEKAVTIGEEAVTRAHFHLHAATHVPGHETMEEVALLHPVSTDVLHGRGTTGPGYQG